jgi:hypothetical protein
MKLTKFDGLARPPAIILDAVFSKRCMLTTKKIGKVLNLTIIELCHLSILPEKTAET